MDSEEFKERKRLYERARDEISAANRSSSESFDKALLTLSSSFLGGSLALIGQVVQLSNATNKWLLYAAWAGFAVAMILTIWSFVYGLLAYRKMRQAAEDYYLKGDQSAWNVSDTVDRELLRFAVAGGVSFVAGVVLLVAFVAFNLAR
jgi:hypothetical protein